MKRNLLSWRWISSIAVAFAMGTSVFATDPNAKFITQSYEDVLGRAANRFEYNMWLNFVDTGGSRAQFAGILTSSAEYKNKLVEGWYLQYLRREPTSTELMFGTQMLVNGATDKQERAMIIGTDEYFQNAGGDNQAFLYDLYADLLGRAPTPAETNAIIAVLVTNGIIGVLRTNAALLVENSAEFDQREIIAIYRQFLRRTPSSSELTFGTQWLVLGVPEESEVDQLIGTDEYLRFCNSR
jgi:hypothetical protein